MARSHHPARKGLIEPFAPRCPAQKNGFLTRKAAKKWTQQIGLQGLDAYRCTHPECEFWHLGHLPTIVKAGVLDRHKLFPVNRSGRSRMTDTENPR